MLKEVAECDEHSLAHSMLTECRLHAWGTPWNELFDLSG
jgi:hypothetical protein